MTNSASRILTPALFPCKAQTFENKIRPDVIKAGADPGNGRGKAARAEHKAGAGELFPEPGAQAFGHGGETEDKAMPHTGGSVAADKRCVRVSFKADARAFGRAGGQRSMRGEHTGADAPHHGASLIRGWQATPGRWSLARTGESCV